MFFGLYHNQLKRPIEDVYLPGDEELFAPVVLASRTIGRGRHEGHEATAYIEDMFEQLIRGQTNPRSR